MKRMLFFLAVAICSLGCSLYQRSRINDNKHKQYTSSASMLEQIAPLTSKLAIYARDERAAFQTQRDSNGKEYLTYVCNGWGNAGEVLLRARDLLPDGLQAYLRITKKEAPNNARSVELLIIAGQSQYDIVRHAGTSSNQPLLSNDQVIVKLQEIDEQLGIDITEAGVNSVAFDLKGLPDEPHKFMGQLQQVCPSIANEWRYINLDIFVENLVRQNRIRLDWGEVLKPAVSAEKNSAKYFELYREKNNQDRILPTVNQYHQLIPQLTEARQALSNFFNIPTREFATYNNGSGRDFSCVSVIVPSKHAHEDIWQLRKSLPSHLRAFIGQEHRHYQREPFRLNEEMSESEIVIAPALADLDIVNYSRIRASNHSLYNRDISNKLAEWDKRFGIEIYLANSDSIHFRFRNLPSDLDVFINELRAFDPDIVDDDSNKIEELKRSISANKVVKLWWD